MARRREQPHCQPHLQPLRRMGIATPEEHLQAVVDTLEQWQRKSLVSVSQFRRSIMILENLANRKAGDGKVPP